MPSTTCREQSRADKTRGQSCVDVQGREAERWRQGGGGWAWNWEWWLTHPLAVGKAAHVALCLLAVDELEVALAWRAENPRDQVELMHVVLSGKEGLPSEKLGKDAADRPDVNGGGVLRARQQELRRPVPPRDDVLGHVLLLGVGPREPKVADLQVAVRVQEQVAWLEVSVKDVRAVNVLESPGRGGEGGKRGGSVSVRLSPWRPSIARPSRERSLSLSVCLSVCECA